MIPKIILNEEETRDVILEAVETLFTAVSVTLGPNGGNVILQQGGNVQSTKDGVTVARSVTSTNPSKDAVIKFVMQAALRANEMAGDGTTSTTVLVRSLLRECLNLANQGVNVYSIAKDLERLKNLILESLNEVKTVVDPDSPEFASTLKTIATISANDEELGALVADVFVKMRAPNYVSFVPVESTKGKGETKVINGFVLDSGYYDKLFVNNKDKQSSYITSPDGVNVIVVHKDIRRVEEVIAIIAKTRKTNPPRPYVLITTGIDSAFLETIFKNQEQHGVYGLVVLAPEGGDLRYENMEDLAAFTGAKLITDSLLRSGLDKVSNLEDYFGLVDAVESTERDTVFFKNTPADGVEEYTTRLSKALPEYTGDSYHRMIARISRLKGVAGTIEYPATTMIEAREAYYRIEDAVSATRSAFKSGVLPGGGASYLYAIDNLGPRINELHYPTLLQALEGPFKLILEPTGRSFNEARSQLRDKEALNTLTNKWGHFLEVQVADPLHVVSTALETAISIVSVLITTKAMIVEDVEYMINLMASKK